MNVQPTDNPGLGQQIIAGHQQAAPSTVAPVEGLAVAYSDPQGAPEPPSGSVINSGGSNINSGGSVIHSGGSVINSEIIIPDEAPRYETTDTDEYHVNHLDDEDVPVILQEDHDDSSDRHRVRSFEGDTYFIAGQENAKSEPVYTHLSSWGGPKYPIPPAQHVNPNELQYVIPPPPPSILPPASRLPEKKVPLDQDSSLGEAKSTIIVVESGPSTKPLPPKVNQPAPSPVTRFRDRRCFCCFAVALVVILFLIVIALAIIIPLLRLDE